MPADWNSADATAGKLTFYVLWTTTGGTPGQTVHWDISGKLYPDDAALNTALAAIEDTDDTLLATGDMHVSGGTTPTVVTSAGTGGQTAIFKITRDSASDNLGATAQLIGVRVGYIRTLA